MLCSRLAASQQEKQTEQQTKGDLYYRCLSSLQWLSNPTWLPVVDMYQQSTGTSVLMMVGVLMMQDIPDQIKATANSNSVAWGEGHGAR